MEHHISRATLEAIRSLTNHLQENPDTLARVKSS